MIRRTTGQPLAGHLGTAFLVLALLGFVPGLTSNYGQLELAGHRSAAELLGIFDVSVLLNLVHAALGVAGLWLARTRAGARGYLLGGGTFNLGLWVFGLLVARTDGANFIPVDAADDWLHFGLGLVMVAAAAAGRLRNRRGQ